MSDVHQPPVAARPRTLTGKIISLPFAAFGVLVGSLLLSVVVEWLGMYFFWPQQGWHHAETMFYSESEQLSATFTQSILLSEPVQTTHALLNGVYQWLFVKTGLSHHSDGIIIAQSSDDFRRLTFKQNLTTAVGYLQNYLLAAAYTTLTFVVRLIILLLSTPLIIMTLFIGLIDGLVRRDIRRFVVSHESGFIYHRAKAFLMPTLALPWVVYLAIPFNIAPLLIILPCALLSGMVMSITASSFKKYL